MENGSKLQILTKGILKESPTLVLLLGCCPFLATTTSAINGLGMGGCTLAVLFFSNIIISAFILLFMFNKYPYLAASISHLSLILLILIMAAIVDIKFYKIKKKLFSQIEKNKKLRIELEEASKEETNDNYKQ